MIGDSEADTIWTHSLSSFFMVTDFNQHAVFSVNLRVKDSSQDISPVLGLNFSLQCHRNFRSVYQGDSLSLFEKINICNEKSAWYSLKCDLLRHLRRQKSEKKNKQTRKR